ncbi:MAG: hypothetical protein KZQ65_08970, partial [Candidatus Thiodiazotropha sp. (ex Gloverina cf. vestifex)]|nr:hypothetical protein [Candidatus Thiodiazotropha sp. (ex Gloverina cf. vestifex)]
GRGITAVALASRFWGLGCPKIFHEVATRLEFIVIWADFVVRLTCMPKTKPLFSESMTLHAPPCSEYLQLGSSSEMLK